MGDKKTNNSKVLWYILFAFITVIMCYLFIVVYFYFISPYNLSLKLAFWPFVPEQNIGEMYLDATVDISFSGKDIYTLDPVEREIVGVNVRIDGYIVAPYDEIKSCTDMSDFKIRTNDGRFYNGKLLFSDVNYNLAVIKCENVGENDKKIKIPYVNVVDVSNVVEQDTSVFAVASPLKTKTMWEGTVKNPEISNVYKEVVVSGIVGVDFVIEDCYSVMLEAADVEFSGGAVFDKSGNILGLSYEETLTDGSHVIMPIDSVNLFLDEIVEAYQAGKTYKNTLVESIVGFDDIELTCFQIASAQNTTESARNTFYFANHFPGYTDNIRRFGNSDIFGYFLFEDFVWNEQTVLSQDKVLTALKLNGKVQNIESKLDLLKVLYSAKENDTLKIYYYEIDSLGSNLQSVSVKI